VWFVPLVEMHHAMMQPKEAPSNKEFRGVVGTNQAMQQLEVNHEHDVLV
jgi:hypothetical protein